MPDKRVSIPVHTNKYLTTVENVWLNTDVQPIKTPPPCEASKKETCEMTVPHIDHTLPPGTCILHALCDCPKMCDCSTCDASNRRQDLGNLFYPEDRNKWRSEFGRIDLSGFSEDKKGEACFNIKSIADVACGNYNIAFFKNNDGSWTNDPKCVNATCDVRTILNGVKVASAVPK